MGCDIHFHIEVKKDTVWQHHDWREPHKQGVYNDSSTKYDYGTMFENPLWISRNYDLFAILADVRNGYGFAGVKTGDGFIPISQPRGLPADVTAEVRSESDGWGCDGHSHSWLTLAELQAYDWDEQSTQQLEWVNPAEYLSFKENGKPNSWCGGVSGGRIVHVSNEGMDRLLKSGEASADDIAGDQDKYYYTRVSWEESYRDAVGAAWFRTMEKLAELDKPENVRIIFWFDN